MKFRIIASIVFLVILIAMAPIVQSCSGAASNVDSETVEEVQ